MDNLSFRRGLISLKELTKLEIETLLEKARRYKQSPPGNLLKGKILATLFFEPSTRTRLSFESAMKRLGGDCIGFSDKEATSVSKGESLSDTVRIVSGYADLIVIRHPLEGSARRAQESATIPVINGGDGANEHPTQTLLDLFTIQETQNRLEGLNILLAGDLKYSRTVHSLVLALRHFNPRLFFVTPRGLELPDATTDFLKEAQIFYSSHASIEEILSKIDILYMTRIQKERFRDLQEYERCKKGYFINKAILHSAKPNLRIFHPLPRNEEIAPDVDKTPYAHYFAQAENGLHVRAALLETILGEGTL